MGPRKRTQKEPHGFKTYLVPSHVTAISIYPAAETESWSPHRSCNFYLVLFQSLLRFLSWMSDPIIIFYENFIVYIWLLDRFRPCEACAWDNDGM